MFNEDSMIAMSKMPDKAYENNPLLFNVAYSIISIPKSQRGII